LNDSFASTSQHITQCGLSSPLITIEVNPYLFLLIFPFSRVFQWSCHDQFTVTLCVVFYDISNRPKLVIAISGLINIANFATYQYKTTIDIISLKIYKEMN
jgi:hypothetical protein